MPDGGFTARVDSLLLELASQEATGCLIVTEPQGEQSTVWFRDGYVYAVSVPGRRPLLGVRLMSSGVLTPEALAEALEVQRTELQGWRLGELLVHLGFVDRAVVESFVCEQVRDQVADLLHWQVAEKKFRNGKRTRQDVAPPMEVTELLGAARRRDEEWASVVPFIGGADAVPVLSTAAPAAPDVVLGPYDWALLCKVDGNRTIADLADDCGFTIFEAGMVVVGLLEAGLVEIDGGEAEEPGTPWWNEDNPSDDDVAASVAKVTAALTDMGMPAATSPFTAAPLRGARTTHQPSRTSPFSSAPAPQLAEVVSLDAEREARDEVDRIEAERAEAERIEAERIGAEEEAARLEAERLEAERIAAEEEAARIEAERVAAEQAREEMARWAAEEGERAAAADLEQAEAESASDTIPTLEPSPWGEPVVTIAPPAFHPDELAPAASVSFADVYGGTAHPEPVTPDTYDELTTHHDVSQPVAVPMPEPVSVAARPTPDYSGGFVVSPEIAQPGASEGADMAALLRELSSLNSDSDSETSRNGVAGMSPVGSSNGQQGQTVTRPVQTSDTKGKKKKGFFGR